MATNYVHDLYPDAEERYEIFVVKAAECPHLLHWTVDHSTSYKEIVEESADNAIINQDDNNDEHDDEKKVDDNMQSSASLNSISTSHPPIQPPPPLTDGCDIPGWRCQRIAPCMNSTDGEKRVDIESPLGGTLNVGSGCALMRRESQFPFMSPSLCSLEQSHIHSCWWYSAKQSFNLPPPAERAAPIIHHDEAARIVDCVTNTDFSKKDHRQITVFCREYEIKSRPVKILGATKGWLAMPCYEHSDDDIAAEQQLNYDNDRNNGESWRDTGDKSEFLSGGGLGGWTFANLLSRFGNVAFRFSDTHGEMMSLHTYAKYITSPEGLSDDSPLGIYDAEFGDDDSPTSVLLDEYSVPECFSDDLFGFADCSVSDFDSANDEENIENGSADLDEEQKPIAEISRPPYRWVLIGPERSGTGMHVDPLWTNAWVTLLGGRKRWLLFPPETPHESIGMIDGEPQIRSSIWFRDFYNKVTSTSWPKEYQPCEVLQLPGETVFVPAGWPHLVLNLELTVAVTHNYASEHGPFFERMRKEVAQDEPAFAVRWHSGLSKSGRGDLASMARGQRRRFRDRLR